MRDKNKSPKGCTKLAYQTALALLPLGFDERLIAILLLQSGLFPGTVATQINKAMEKLDLKR